MFARNIQLYFALGIIALSFPVMIVSNRTYVAPLGRESEFPPTRVVTWRSLLQKTQFLTVRSITMLRYTYTRQGKMLCLLLDSSVAE